MGAFTHAVRDWACRPVSTYSLSDDALVQDVAGIETRLPYEDIVEIRLALSPGFPRTRRRCTVVRTSGPDVTIPGQHYVESQSGPAYADSKSGRMLALLHHLTYREDRSATFGPLVAGLLERAGKSNPQCRFVAGSTGWWLTATACFTLFAGLVVLFAIPVFTRAKLGALVPMTIFGALLPWFWPVVRAGPSRSIDPRNPPRIFLRSPSGNAAESSILNESNSPGN